MVGYTHPTENPPARCTRTMSNLVVWTDVHAREVAIAVGAPAGLEAMLPTALKNPIYMSRSLAWPSDLAHFAAG
jgi:hypothetical protein